MDTRAQRCQSCGTEIDSMGLRGTNKDGSAQSEYCLHCYQQGGFVHPQMTLTEMMENVASYMIHKLNVSEDKARAFVFTIIPHLKRWKRDAVT